MTGFPASRRLSAAIRSDARFCVIERRLGQDFGADHTRSTDRAMELGFAAKRAPLVPRRISRRLHSPSPILSRVLCCRPMRCHQNRLRQQRPDDAVSLRMLEGEPQERTWYHRAREQIVVPQPEERRHEPLVSWRRGTAEDEPDRQRRFDSRGRSTSTARPAGRIPVGFQAAMAGRRESRTVTSPRRTRARS